MAESTRRGIFNNDSIERRRSQVVTALFDITEIIIRTEEITEVEESGMIVTTHQMTMTFIREVLVEKLEMSAIVRTPINVPVQETIKSTLLTSRRKGLS